MPDHALPTERRNRLNVLLPYLLTLPALAALIGILYPFVLGVYYTFTNYTLTEPGDIRWIGLTNYIEIFRNPRRVRLVPGFFVSSDIFVAPFLVVVHPWDHVPARSATGRWSGHDSLAPARRVRAPRIQEEGEAVAGATVYAASRRYVRRQNPGEIPRAPARRRCRMSRWSAEADARSCHSFSGQAARTPKLPREA